MPQGFDRTVILLDQPSDKVFQPLRLQTVVAGWPNQFCKLLRFGFVHRARLKQVPLSQFVYGQLKRELTADDKNPFRVSDAAGPRGAKVFQRASGKGLDEGIPGLFTYRGYYTLYKKNSGGLVDRFRNESWVLGVAADDLGKVELEQLDAQVGKLYYADYIRNWQDLLNDLRIVPLTSTAQVPHSPNSQPCLVPVSPKSSWRTSSKVLCGAKRTSVGSPLT